MRIHTNRLEYGDFAQALRESIPDAWLVHFSPHNSRKRNKAFEIKLEAEQRKGRRRANVGTRFGDHFDRPFVPTFDEWGAFIARLYEADPDAIVGPYTSVEEFHATTRDKYRIKESA